MLSAWGSTSDLLWPSTWLLYPWGRALWPAPRRLLWPLSWGGCVTLSPLLFLWPADPWYWPLGVELLEEVLDWLLALPLYPHLALLRLLSAWASLMEFLGSFGIVPTNLATGLDVALGGPGVGLAGLGLLGPASVANDDGPAWQKS